MDYSLCARGRNPTRLSTAVLGKVPSSDDGPSIGKAPSEIRALSTPDPKGAMSGAVDAALHATPNWPGDGCRTAATRDLLTEFRAAA